ncbi:MAG: SRPBCC domain-containing protein [Limisphaerales bacterium]
MNAKNNPPEALVLERTFDAPIIAVWKALTNVDEMRRWYFDLKEFRPEPGFEFRFIVKHEGNSYDHRCKVTEAVPNKKIAYTWRYEGHEGDSLVTFELFPEGDKTRLKLTHQGLETFPKTPAHARQNYLEGWTQLIGISLKDYVENVDREIVITRDFDAPRELVWEAMTNPKHVVNWWGPRGFSTTIETMDFRVGGVWKHVMHGPDGVNYPNEKVFKEIVKPEKIVFSHGGRREGGPSVDAVATWTFDEVASGKTKVTLRMVFPSAKERDFVVKEFGAIEGGKQTLERLGEYLPKMK